MFVYCLLKRPGLNIKQSWQSVDVGLDGVALAISRDTSPDGRSSFLLTDPSKIPSVRIASFPWPVSLFLLSTLDFSVNSARLLKIKIRSNICQIFKFRRICWVSTILRPESNSHSLVVYGCAFTSRAYRLRECIYIYIYIYVYICMYNIINNASAVACVCEALNWSRAGILAADDKSINSRCAFYRRARVSRRWPLCIAQPCVFACAIFPDQIACYRNSGTYPSPGKCRPLVCTGGWIASVETVRH